MGIVPTMLYATNAKVDELNLNYYNNLEGTEFKYEVDFTWFRPCNKEAMMNNIRFHHNLALKVGSQVMFLVNDSPLVNGSRGVVTGFIEGYPEVLFTDGHKQIITRHTLDVEVGDEKIMSYSQVPLRLSWAMSIHKSQGCTLDLLCVDLNNVFEYGQFYVALSRARTLDGLFIRNLDFNRNYTHPKALEFYGH
jgi:ATP-dependent DNA helicase PIF1